MSLKLVGHFLVAKQGQKSGLKFKKSPFPPYLYNACPRRHGEEGMVGRGGREGKKGRREDFMGGGGGLASGGFLPSPPPVRSLPSPLPPLPHLTRDHITVQSGSFRLSMTLRSRCATYHSSPRSSFPNLPHLKGERRLW